MEVDAGMARTLEVDAGMARTIHEQLQRTDGVARSSLLGGPVNK